MRRSGSVAISLALGTCCLVTGCGGGSNSNSGAGGAGGSGGAAVIGTPIPFTQYPTAVADTLCPPLSTCCSTLGLALTTAQCTTTLGALTGSTAGADPSKYTYDPVAAGNCIAAARQEFSSSTCTTNQLGSDPLCGNVFTGIVAPGEPCKAKIECAHQATDEVSCRVLTIGAGGAGTVCVVERRVGVGQPCYWTCTEESGGLRLCSGGGSVETALQGRCFTNDGLYCGSDGVCHTRGKIGAACSGSNSCAEGYCDFTTNVCTAKAAQNGACTMSDGCLDGLYCKTQVCTPDLAAGAACQAGDKCLNGNCTNNVCVANPAITSNQIGMALLCGILASGGLK